MTAELFNSSSQNSAESPLHSHKSLAYHRNFDYSHLNLQLSLTIKRWQSWLSTCQEHNLPRKNWRQNCQWISKSTNYSHGCDWSNYGNRGKFSWNWRWPKYLAGKDTWNIRSTQIPYACFHFCAPVQHITYQLSKIDITMTTI